MLPAFDVLLYCVDLREEFSQLAADTAAHRLGTCRQADRRCVLALRGAPLGCRSGMPAPAPARALQALLSASSSKSAHVCLQISHILSTEQC